MVLSRVSKILAMKIQTEGNESLPEMPNDGMVYIIIATIPKFYT